MNKGKHPLRIALLFGGPGMERDVSFASAKKVLAALRSRAHQVTAIDLSLGVLRDGDEQRVLGATAVPEKIPDARRRDGREFGVLNDLRSSDFDIVFLALHGSPGEDGIVQAALDLKVMPYTGSSFSACARTYDKHSAKLRLRAAGVDTPEWLIVRRGGALDDLETIDFPAVVKPRREGSTIGISLANSVTELANAVAHARAYCDDVLIERYIAGREITVGVLNGKALALGEILLPPMELFDYAKKYQLGRVQEVFPAEVTTTLSAEISRIALASHDALELGTYSRVDIRLDAQQRPWVLEVNSLPGLTETSLLPQSALAAGCSFEDLCDAIANAAVSSPW
jgi:D-alanine-D-alanine ligase